MPTLDLARFLQMERGRAKVIDGVSFRPCGEIGRDVSRGVVRQEPGLIGDGGLLDPSNRRSQLHEIPLAAREDEDLQSLCCLVKNEVHSFQAPFVGVHEGIVEDND